MTLIIVVFGIIFYFNYTNLKKAYGEFLSFKSEYLHDYNNKNYTFGVDVSHYQEEINWKNVKISKHPIKYVFIRATMGSNRKDITFKDNWKNSKKNGFIRGAYHYYDPNENSTEQANNFINSVELKKGDFPPVLDIEELSKFGNINLHKGLKNWLKLIESKYKVKPIIYTGLKYYEENLKEDFNNYPLWIAAYSRSKKRMNQVNWQFHQFTDKVKVYGINTYVDGNDFNGTEEDLNKILIP